MEKKRSVGIVIIGGIAILFGLLFLKLYHFLCYNKIFGLIFVSSLFVSGIFVLKLKNWARILLIAQMVCVAIAGLKLIWYAYEMRGVVLSAMSLIGILFGLLFLLLPSFLSIFYLARPRVKALFSPPKLKA